MVCLAEIWQKGIANNSRMAECLEEKRAHVSDMIIDVTSQQDKKHSICLTKLEFVFRVKRVTRIQV
jgi:hypothetical protein